MKHPYVLWTCIVVLCAVLAAPALAAQPSVPDAPTLDPGTIPKFAMEIAGPPPVFVPTSEGGIDYYEITMTQSSQQILPKPFPSTRVWGYGGKAMDLVSGKNLGFLSNSPAATIEATRGTPIAVTWQNAIGRSILPVDPTLHWADPEGKGMLCCGDGMTGMDGMCSAIDCTQRFPPGYNFAQNPVPLVTHLHGAEVQSLYDGHPDAWWTVNGKHGSAYATYAPTKSNAAVFYYPNEQPATTLWYHDHALGMTRLNVASGLAGFYLIRDPADPVEQALDAAGLVQTKYEVPLAIQDRSFNKDGSLWFPSVGNSPGDHPYWNPEFFGDVIMVDGKVWPKMYVDQGVYRLRLLDGSNARFYTLSFDNGMEFTQIGSEGGFLKEAVTMDELTIAPGERADLLVDFSAFPEGTEIVLTNSANTPFPDGDPVTENAAIVMKCIVTGNAGPEMPDLPACLNPTLCGTDWPTLPEPSNERTLVLQEIMNMTNDEPVMVTLNGHRWMADITEKPALGSTEEWTLVNPTMDAHPIHLHLVQFQLVGRITMDTDAYAKDWIEHNQMMLMEAGYPEDEIMMTPPWPDDFTPMALPISDYVDGAFEPASGNEIGWKDTIQTPTGFATIIRARWAPIDGSEEYPFDATEGPGYVWHCHILDHEDNEMMRPYIVA